jgi:acetolactate synthase small subunit
MKTTMCCLLQNRMGALERVLEAFTYRGIMPEHLVSTLDPKTGCTQVIVTFECEEEKMLEKLIKFLNKQIYVLEINRMSFTRQEASPMTSVSNLAPLFAPAYAPVKRRIAHVTNA